MNNQKKQAGSKQVWSPPLVVAMVVAIVGVTGMLIVDHGSWTRKAEPEPVNYSTTNAAAHAVGATVTPTEPKLDVEPVAPGPTPVQPANPVSSP